jgi:23S rRNA (uracil1939-C5)-methyltransferase
MTIAEIESLDHEAHGVTHVEGKAVFIDGALPGEEVEFEAYRKKSSFDKAKLIRILRKSELRTAPRCPHFGTCGGCNMQHLEAHAQVAVKQRVLEDNLARIGKVRAERLLPPIYGPFWGYRHRARLSVRNVQKKGGVLVGFHEKQSSFVCDMTRCEILPPRISAMLPAMRELVNGLSIRDRMPQIELAAGDRVDALVLRILEPLTAADEDRIRRFAEEQQVCMYLQPKGPDSVYRFHPLEAPPLDYALPDYGITMPYSPTEFTQVNPLINRVLVRRAMTLLDPRPGERIADFFCGLGNFTLPIARLGARVTGFEGSRGLILRAQENARHNGLENDAAFVYANLFEMTGEVLASHGRFDKWLVDPPRDGAVELVKAIGAAGAGNAPGRIVYVSCNPATLARDAAVLTHTLGYVLRAAGVVNMFPHTAHVESVALFER